MLLKLFQSCLQTQIDVINYWLVAQAQDACISAHSKYWAKFHLSRPTFSKPTRDAFGHSTDSALAVGTGFRLNDTTVNTYWDRRTTIVKALRAEFADAVERLASELTDAKTYMDVFVAGNGISGSFYQ